MQFIANDFTAALNAADIRISKDGLGRTFDNIFIHQLWRNVKYEDIYVKDYPTASAPERGLHDCFEPYNYERPHQSLAYCASSRCSS